MLVIKDRAHMSIGREFSVMKTCEYKNCPCDGWVFGTGYNYGMLPPRYPVPATCNHLDLIAAEPMQGWEDFKAIAWHGKR
jgi:hypothetical protein